MPEDHSVELALIGIVATMVATGGWIIKYFADKLSSDIREHSRTSVELKTYLVDRNGRDAEQHKENMRTMKKMNASVDNLQIVVKNQHVKHQVVDEQDVKKVKK